MAKNYIDITNHITQNNISFFLLECAINFLLQTKERKTYGEDEFYEMAKDGFNNACRMLETNHPNLIEEDEDLDDGTAWYDYFLDDGILMGIMEKMTEVGYSKVKD